MLNLKHSPGPWEATKGHIGSKIADFVRTDKKFYDGMHIHNGEKVFGISTPESEANARLIAAAPEMLETLIKLYKGDDMFKGTLQNLIEKATGLPIEEIIK